MLDVRTHIIALTKPVLFRSPAPAELKHVIIALTKPVLLTKPVVFRSPAPAELKHVILFTNATSQR